jgi:hypothetical protein
MTLAAYQLDGLAERVALLERTLPTFTRKTRRQSRQVDAIAHAEQLARERLSALDAASQNRLLKAYRRSGREIRRTLRAIMAKYPKGQWNYSDAIRYGDLARIFGEARLRIGDLGFRTFRDLEDDLAQAYRYASGFSAYQLDIATPPDIGISFASIPEPQVRAILDQPFEGARFSQRWGQVTNEMAQRVQGELVQSMIQGEGIPEATKRVMKVFQGEYARSITIARSEIIRASTLGKQQVIDENRDLIDAEHPKEWVVTDDDSMCEFCQAIQSDDRYRLAGSDHMFLLPDGRRVLGPPAHPRCRCTPLPRLKSWAELIDPSMKADEDDIGLRAIRNPETGKTEIVDLPTYERWSDTWEQHRELMNFEHPNIDTGRSPHYTPAVPGAFQ